MDRLAATDPTVRIRDYIPLGRYGDKRDVANMAVFLFSDAANWVTGQVMVRPQPYLVLPVCKAANWSSLLTEPPFGFRFRRRSMEAMNIFERRNSLILRAYSTQRGWPRRSGGGSNRVVLLRVTLLFRLCFSKVLRCRPNGTLVGLNRLRNRVQTGLERETRRAELNSVPQH